MKNIDVRIAVSDAGLKYKDIAQELGISPEWLSRLMRYTLTAENKALIMETVERMKGAANERENS